MMVTDAEGPVGEQVVLQLILSRQVRAILAYVWGI